MGRMRRGAVPALIALVSCTDLSKRTGPDASVTVVPTESVDPTPVPPPQVLALNQGDIARYPDETPMAAPAKAAFQRGFNIRESIPNGKVVTGLGRGAVGTQIAKRAAYVLITFDDPSSPGVTMMGWVHQDAFSLVVATPDAGTLTCATGETALFSDVPTCGRVCTKDAECIGGLVCNGNSNKLATGNKPGDAVKVCVPSHDAGVPSANLADAGKPSVLVDAGSRADARVEAGATATDIPTRR